LLNELLDLKAKSEAFKSKKVIVEWILVNLTLTLNSVVCQVFENTETQLKLEPLDLFWNPFSCALRQYCLLCQL